MKTLSDEEVLNNRDEDDDLDLPCLNSEVMDSMFNDVELHEDFVDDILREAAFEEETIHKTVRRVNMVKLHRARK